MHYAADLNLNWLVQFTVTIFILGLGFALHRLLKNTASKYLVFDNNTNHSQMASDASEPCAVCNTNTTKRCSNCKIISYCSQACQRSHWISEHKATCNNLKSISKANPNRSTKTWQERKADSTSSSITKMDTAHHSSKILFPYGEFVELFDWESPGFSPCGLLNCGNSCFANVVLQCLAYTKPLVAYLLVKGHKRECRRNSWCFLCEFQMHLQRASQSLHPFSPVNILSRLPNIGGNLGHDSQEDAHEFMRFAIDNMQSVCLDQFGGEKVVHPRSQETTLIQHIFGGQLQSQVICTKCNNISNQLENMMDLTVEIQGDAESLEECLDQFTAKERLHGENMYKCDRCNEYVTAWKRLSVLLPPNILTIALKRFQSGKFGKLNKRVTFPETLDLKPYMSKAGGDDDIYKLYAVIVHVDMLNASFFGHYICYVKDFRDQWYRIDDSKVARVDLDEVLSQGAYMVLYSRVRARPRCMNPLEPNGHEIKKDIEHNEETPPPTEESAVECPSIVPEDRNAVGVSDNSAVIVTSPDGRACSSNSYEDEVENMDKVNPGATPFVENVRVADVDESSYTADEIVIAPGNSNGIVLSSGKSIKEDGTEKVADTLPISFIEDKKTEGDSSNGSMNDTSFPIGIATRKAETTSYKPDNKEQLTSSRGTPEVDNKCYGTDKSGLKLKPIFSPGFLGKQQQRKGIKRPTSVLENQQKSASRGPSCSPSNGFSNANVHCHDDSFTDKKNTYPYCHTKVSSNNSSKDTKMIHEGITGQEVEDLAHRKTPNRITGQIC